jgi:hypothetical protein
MKFMGKRELLALRKAAAFQSPATVLYDRLARLCAHITLEHVRTIFVLSSSTDLSPGEISFFIYYLADDTAKPVVGL